MKPIKTYAEYKKNKYLYILLMILISLLLISIISWISYLDFNGSAFLALHVCATMLLPIMRVVLCIMELNEKSYYEYIIETKEKNEKFKELKNKATIL